MDVGNEILEKNEIPPPPQFYENLRRRIDAKTPNKSANGVGCWEWCGTKKFSSAYGVVNLTVGGDHLCVHAHRASYMAFNNKFILPHDISHCCHHSLCVNPNHLSHEPHEINMARERCRRSGSCFGHESDGKPLKPCIFGDKPEE